MGVKDNFEAGKNKRTFKACPSRFAQFLLVLQLEAVCGFSQFSWSWAETLLKKPEVKELNKKKKRNQQ